MTQALVVDLLDPELFSSNRFWDVFACLRANDPVHWHHEPNGPGFWTVTRYRDVTAVYAGHESFSSRQGMRLGSSADAVSAVAQRMLIVSDPPDHTQLKRVLSRAFVPGEMPKLERVVDQVVRDVVADAVEVGVVDFIHVAKLIPNYVVCAVMDLPREEWAWVGQTTTDAFEGADEQTRSGANSEIFLYFEDLLNQRRGSDSEDFISRIAREKRATEGDERLLTDEEIIFNCNGVLSGANETTRYSTAGGVLALAESPDQWRALQAAGPSGIAPAVEEILRWTVPGMHTMRTVTRPVTVGDVQMNAGDRVTSWNGSANRDEDMFPDPDRFLVDRSPNRHIAFGSGRHLCLGARLARLEMASFLRELVDRVDRVDRVELTGEPLFNASNFTWGLTHLPVRLVPRRT